MRYRPISAIRYISYPRPVGATLTDERATTNKSDKMEKPTFSFQKIQFELECGIDKHSRTLISSNIELFLNYSQRFYDRQFITREYKNKGVLERFENLLLDYFNADLQLKNGIPTVSYCAKELNLSSNYFGDLVKKESGVSALEYIRTSVINLAKDKILESGKSVSDVAYELGFRYPQHFTRLFKLKVGLPPTQYKTLVNK